MTPRALLKQTAARFREAGLPDPETDSALLLSPLMGGQPPLALRLDDETELGADLLARYESLARRRLGREPLQYILGETWFGGLCFRVDRRALIPRPETEQLCEWAAETLAPAERPLSLLDLCCGSGCIGLTMKARFPALRVTLADVSGDALALAGENAERLHLAVTLHRGDLFGGLDGCRFDRILSNPPYIPAAECDDLQPEVLREPRSALDGGADGLDFYRRIVDEAPAHLTPGGLLMMELGFGQAPAVRCLLAAAGYREIAVQPDFRGIDRMIRAVRPAEES